MATSQGRVEVRGLSVAYRSAGSGPPLVLLHGFLCDSRVWRVELETLSDAFRIVAWDAPGAGDSSDPPESFTISDWADCLAAFLDAVDVERGHVLGLSWGGLLAQILYQRHPARVVSLVLADTYMGWKGSFGEEVAQQRLARCSRESSLPAHEFVRTWVPTEFFSDAPSELRDEMGSVVSEFHPRGFQLMAQTLAETDTTDLLRTIDVPTLLLWGEGDQRSPPEIAERFHAAIPGSELVVIPSAGHVSNMERPEEFAAHVRRFCLANQALWRKKKR